MAQVLSFEDDTAVSFASKLATSESFKSLFREGMNLVEETAGYLDGAGREEAKALPRLAALAYATESMRLTTRLMQLASWLLLQRAVNEGELTQTEAAEEKRKVRVSEQLSTTSSEVMTKLPAQLLELVEKSLRLQTRIVHFDRLIYQPAEKRPRGVAAPSAVETQLDLLRAAFEADKSA
jgi:regulator of CtrA degradation